MTLYDKFKRIFIFAIRIIFKNTYFLISSILISPIKTEMRSLYIKVNGKIKQYIRQNNNMHYWKTKRNELLKFSKDGYVVNIIVLGLNPENLEFLKNKQKESREVVIAEIDQDGFYLSYFGPIENITTISSDSFMRRERFEIKLVSINGYIGIKKHYINNKIAFVNEITALHKLGLAGCNVPVILDVDFANLTLTSSFILGHVLREELAKKGAVVRDRDVNNNPDFIQHNRKERWLKRIQEGKSVLYDVIDPQFTDALFSELCKVHAVGFILNDIKYGNIIIEKISGKPYLIDFDRAIFFSNHENESFTVLRDLEVEQFNLHFGTNKLIQD